MSGVQSVLISGQKINSRTETLEEWAKPRFERVGVYAFSSPQARHGDGRWTVYQSGREDFSKAVPSRHVPGRKLQWLFLPGIFLRIVFKGISLARETGRRWDVFIGVALVSTLMGLALRRLGLVDRVIYYCLDYYVPGKDMPLLDRAAIRAFQWLDRRAALLSDFNWLVCDRIAEARREYGGVDPSRYRWIEVPLGYDRKLLHHPEPDPFDPCALGFVGSLSENQGLQLVLETMPELRRRFPHAVLHILGTGGYEPVLRRQAEQLALGDSVVFHGFIPEEKQVLEKLCRCAVGLATWTGDASDNARFADPGKPKLYAMCGIPTLITPTPKIAAVMQREEAGVAVPYDRSELLRALSDLLGDPQRLRRMRRRTREFAHTHCMAETYFKKGMEAFDAAGRREHP